MTDTIDDIVSVQISRETTAVQIDSFGTVMIMGTHKVFNDRLKFYSSLAEMTTDGFTSSTKEYLAAQKLLSQNPRVETFAVGRRSVDDASVVVSTVTAATLYTITINGVDCEYTSAGSGDDATDIGEGLEAAINAASISNSWGLTATNTTGTIAIVQAVEDTAWSLSVGARLTISTLVSSADIEDDLAAIQEEDNNWYGLVITSRVSQDVQDVAAWVEANKKIFGTASADTNILDDEATTDIAYILNTANYSRTFVMYHKDAATVYPEAAWFGERFPFLPGKGETWAFRELSGISDSNLNTNQRTAAFDKKANTFELRGGASITMEGWMASGEFIDVMRGLDWLESTIQTYIYFRLVNSNVPFTDAGVAIIETELRRALDLAVTQGVLASFPEYTVTAPLVADVSPADKAIRNLPEVEFTATLSGAIHHVNIIGSVSV